MAGSQHLSPRCSSSNIGVQQQVAAAAAEYPAALAVVANNEVVTYRELESRANSLAHCLRFHGVGPDVPVGLCLSRSVEMVVGALAIWKAGGAYVPMDPGYPPDRLAFMLEDAQAPVLLTNASLPAWAGAVKVIDLSSPELTYPLEQSLPIETGPANLAYVIYTSGSTGRPKGVEITHGGLSNLVSWHHAAFAVTSNDRASHLAGLGFDAAVWELWPYLAVGASLYLTDEVTRTSAESLRDWLIAHRITISFAPTPLAERLLRLEWPPQPALRLLLTGGDVLHRCPPPGLPFTLVNNYGPTECTVVATSATIAPDAQADTLPPIGRGIKNTEIYILDERLQPVPSGTSAEIYIGGEGLARGYRNQPDLTREKFIPNPFRSDRSSRLYKTGDLGAELPDGQIAFRGRIDDQVKIRGYRIEPNEIVTVLNRRPDIRESLVMTRPDAMGDPQLVAYVVPNVNSTLSHASLRTFLSDYVPEYMVPAVFIELERFPLTPNGKIDRRALPEPGAGETPAADIHELSASPVESRLTGILTALLGTNRVSVDDNFFQIGGHSLLGAQVLARVRDTFGVELSLRSLFEQPTVRGMSAEIERLIFAKLENLGNDEALRVLGCSESISASR